MSINNFFDLTSEFGPLVQDVPQRRCQPGKDLSGGGRSGNDDCGGDRVGEVGRTARGGLGDDSQQFAICRRSHSSRVAGSFDHGQALFGGQSGSDDAFQCGVDLGE